MNDSDHLVSLKLKDGRHIDFARDSKKNVVISHDGIDTVLPKATGLATLKLVTLLTEISQGKVEED